jgi:CBS domain containing-hemolysin-like protein
LIEDTEEAGLLGSTQAEFVRRAFRLSAKRVRDCMVPREKMAVLALDSPPGLVLEAARRGAHTRMPVYEGELDNVVGIVNTKDLFYLFSLKGVVILADALYPPLFLKPDEEVANAFQLFRKARRPMALVRDDEGQILGLITLEDVLEEIVGDIEDEHDQPRPNRYSGKNPFVLSREPTAHPSGTGGSPGERTKIRYHDGQGGSDV